MNNWMLRYDLRTTPGFGTPNSVLYAAALEQCAWADEHGCPGIMLAEHHASPDGYLPSPAVMAAGVAARTSSTRLLVVQTSLRDPFAVAEDLAVLDNMSAGRLELVLTVAYAPEEFAPYGEPFSDRVAMFEDKAQALIDLLEGREARFLGRRGRVFPRPVQAPRPVIRFGGTTPASARRAARLADAYMPIVPDPKLLELYQAECAVLGRASMAYPFPPGGMGVLVVDDPDRAWATLGQYLLHDMASYSRWKSADHSASPFPVDAGIDELRASGLYSLVTPDQCVDLAVTTPAPSSFFLHPLVGGIPPEIGWESLHMFVNKVLPRLTGPPLAAAVT